MNSSFKKQCFRGSNKIPSIASAAVIAVTLVGFPLTAQAGKITSIPSAPSVPPNPTEFLADGFGGWNLDNVEVLLHGTQGNIGDDDLSWFDPSDGSYSFGTDSDFTYQSNVSDDLGVTMGYVLAKDWPVGEPSGIKIVNDDVGVKEPKPQNCIMATSYLADHFLDSVDPLQVTCSGPFQSHKRYKLAMLPTTVADGAGLEKGIDLVFNVEAEAGSRDYQIFQKINNWTDGRLEGFTIQVGTGIGSNFTLASDETSGVGVGNLSLSVPAEIWTTADQLAVFSAGLFGPPDLKHDRPAGFFDPKTRAGFEIAEYPNLSGQTDTLTSGATLGSDYAQVPTNVSNQFGPWLPNTMLPTGIFWDDDGNPETDAELLAWYGWNPALQPAGLGWMTGAAEGFAEVSAATIIDWGTNLEYTQDVIDDLVNVGLNYIVTVGDVASFSSTFTIRITPAVDTSNSGLPADEPVYVGETPVPSLQFTSPDGIVAISPAPEFLVGELLTLRVGDGNIAVDVDDESVEVTVTDKAVDGECAIISNEGGIIEETVELIEQGEDRRVYAATTDAFIEVTAGTVVTVIYTDANNGTIENVVKCSSTIATNEILPMPVAEVSITDFSAPTSLFVGRTAKLSVTVTNAKESEVPVSGTVTIKAEGFTTYNEDFVDLAPNKKLRVSNNWTDVAAGLIDWTATVTIDSQDVDTATATTEVLVKPGNNNGNN